MFHRTRVRCSNCGRLVTLDVLWATRDACPRCQASLNTPGVDSMARPAREPGAEDPEPIVSGWVEAFNAGDLDGMLERMSRRVDFHPLRLSGLEREYVGHDGIKQWFEQVTAMGLDHRIELSEVQDAGHEQALAFGDVTLRHAADVMPFWSLIRLRESKIFAAYQYLTDPDIMDYIRVGE